MWVVTPTLSPAVRRRFGLMPRRGWPAGVRSADAGWQLHVIVVHELPSTPDTLWLRMLGRGKVQRRAFDELDALPASHPLRSLSLEHVVHYVAVTRQHPHPSAEDQELWKNADQIVARYQQELIARGEARGKVEGEARGKVEGEANGKAEAVLVVLEERGLPVSTVARRRVLSCRDLAQLDTWLRRAASTPSVRALFD